MRPLISSADPKKSVDISRKAELYETSSGLITITGGKLTTWRRMAKMVVDRMVEREFRDAPCRTHEIPLGHPVDPAMLHDASGIGEESRAHLAGRYGLFAERVLAICAEDEDMRRPIVEGMPDLLAEAVVAARHEQARTVADVLLRRTRLGLLAGRRTVEDRDVALRVAKAMAPERGGAGATSSAPPRPGPRPSSRSAWSSGSRPPSMPAADAVRASAVSYGT